MAEANRIVVPPVEAGAARPLWSVMIPTYNCADYLRETLASVLAQDPGPEQMQIEVVDDCSTRDDPEAVVRELAGERVVFHRQARNVGHVRNFETCLLRSRGELVHLLHGDDRVRPDFYRTMQEPFLSDPRIGAAFCRHIYMDEQGNWKALALFETSNGGILPDALVRIASRQPIQPPAVVVRRSVYEHLGGFDRRMPHCGEDWEMWVRIAARYGIWYEPEPLAEYRQHKVSLTGRSLLRGDNIRDVRRAVEIYREYLPASATPGAVREIHERIAKWAIEIAAALLERGESRSALAQLREAFRTSASPRIAFRAGLALAYALRTRMKPARADAASLKAGEAIRA